MAAGPSTHADLCILNVDNANDTNFNGQELAIDDIIIKAFQNALIRLKDKHVHNNGRMVDYKAMKSSSDFKEFAKTTSRLHTLNLNQMSETRRTALFINCYNALVIHGVVSMETLPKSILDCRHFWKNTAYKIGNETYTLDEIEHGILRGNRPQPTSSQAPFPPLDPRNSIAVTIMDPRIHFAKATGTKSSPRFQVYTEQNLDQELNDAAVFFCENNVQPNKAKRFISLSKIFRWYQKDFAKDDTEIIRWILPYVSVAKKAEMEELMDELQEHGSVNITYEEFNWELNGCSLSHDK